jgi:hypothetical protein
LVAPLKIKNASKADLLVFGAESNSCLELNENEIKTQNGT